MQNSAEVEASIMRGRAHRRPSRLADISPHYQHAQPCAYLGLQLQGRRHSRPLRHAAESLQNSAEQSEGHAVRNAARTELRRFRIIEGVEVDYSRSAEQRSAATQRSAIKKCTATYPNCDVSELRLNV